jgi:hypothetical protein
MNTKLIQLIKKELNLLKTQKDYWGKEEQIKNEIYILNKTKIEIKYNECLEEWLSRILKTL